MSPINHLSVLAFVAGALAIPYGHGHGHYSFHSPHHTSGGSWASGSGIPYPYPVANATGIWGSTGTGAPTGYWGAASSYSSPVAPVSASNYQSVVTVSPLPASSSIASYGNAESTSDCPLQVTTTVTSKTYFTVTATYPFSSSAEVSPVSESYSSNGSTTTVTVQSTYYATTITTSSSASANTSTYSSLASAVGFSSYPSNSTSSAAAYAPSSAAAYTPSSAAAYTPSTEVTSSSTSSSSSEAAPVTTSESSSAPASTSYAVPSSYTPVPQQSSYTAVSSTLSTSSASPSATATTSSDSSSDSTGAKRGLAYNDASLLQGFIDSSNVGFAYNWGSSPSGFDQTSSVKYIPLLWGSSSDFTDSWSDNAQAAIDAGSDTLFSFNEPDMSTEANLSPEDAAAAYLQYMEPFAGKAKLCAPAVTNGGGSMGLTWLSEFLSACSGCTIDCVNIHWYSQYEYADTLKTQITNATQIGGGKPVYVSEFAPTDGSDDDKTTFLQDVMPWMDSNSDVLGYFYFMVSDGLLITGTEPSALGSTYMS